MPVMDGVEATRRIMAQTPCAILVVTATVEGHTAKVFEALGAGALDVVQTPVIEVNGQLDGAPALKLKIADGSRLRGLPLNGAGALTVERERVHDAAPALGAA